MYLEFQSNALSSCVGVDEKVCNFIKNDLNALWRVLLLDLAEVNSDISIKPSADSWKLSVNMESLEISGLKNKIGKWNF